MTDNEKIQSFSDMVEATEKMAKPWQEECERLHGTLRRALTGWAITAAILAIVICVFIAFAYMSPVESEQTQDFENQTQSQTYSERPANGG